MLPILLASIALAAERVVPMPRESELHFRVQPPAGWIFSDETSFVYRWRSIYASFHSAGPADLRLTVETVYDPPRLPGDSEESLRGRSVRYSFGQEAMEAQVPPGVVYVDIGTDYGGPFDSGPYVWREERSPERVIAAVLADPKPTWDTDLSTGYSIHFARWGAPWSVLVIARKPYDPADLEQALAAVGTLRLDATPVLSGEHAIEAATPFLRPDMLPDDVWFDDCGGFDRYDTVTEQLGTSFRVEFQVLDGTEARMVIRNQVFRVNRDCTVVDISDRSER